MKFMIIFILTFTILMPAFSSSDSYGSKLSSTPAIQLSNVIKNFPQWKDKNIVVKGKVSKVCAKKGCWMILDDGKDTVRVTFKDYGFFVPVGIQNKEVKIEGKLNVKMESIDEIKHYLEDEGVSRSKIDAVKVPKKIFHFIATGVEQV